MYWTGNNTNWGTYGIQAKVFREQSNNPDNFTENCYKFQWDGNSSGRWCIERRVNSSWTLLVVSTDNPIREDQWYKMKVIADSSDIQCLVNYEDGTGWKEIFNYDISGDGTKYYNGYAGLFMNWNYEPEAQAIDYYKVRSLGNSSVNEYYSVSDSTVTPAENFNGELTVPVYVTDQTANSDTMDMTITVKPANNAPVLTSVTDQSTDEDTPITLKMSMVTASDADGDPLNIIPVGNMLFSDNFNTNLIGTKWFTRDENMPGGSSPELASIKDTLGASGVLFAPGGKRDDHSNYNGDVNRLADTNAVCGGDYEIEARMYWTGNNTNWGTYGLQAIVFREQSNNPDNFTENCYKFQWDGNSSGRWCIERRVNSSWTL